MGDEQLMSVEFNLFFDEDGNLGPGGGLHLKVTNIGKFDEKTLADTLSTGFRAVKAVREVAEVSKTYEAPPQEPAQPPQDARERAPKPQGKDTPRCQAKGVWASAKGNYKEGFRRGWRHNDPRTNQQGELYCPTPIEKDDDGNLVWCGWRAVENKDGSWTEVDMNAPEEAELPFE